MKIPTKKMKMKPTAILTAALLCVLSPISFAKPIKVFILAGQSNMEGQGSVDHDDERDSNGGKGNLVWSMKHSKSAEKMKKLKNEKGEWVVRDDVQIPEYAQLLVNLVGDLRKEFNVPNMPVVVGELGNDGPVTSGAMFEFRKAQEEGTKRIKNALFIKTTDFARPPELSPCPTHGHHWYANAESYFLIGEAAGEGMKRLLK